MRYLPMTPKDKRNNQIQMAVAVIILLVGASGQWCKVAAVGWLFLWALYLGFGFVVLFGARWLIGLIRARNAKRPDIEILRP